MKRIYIITSAVILLLVSGIFIVQIQNTRNTEILSVDENGNSSISTEALTVALEDISSPSSLSKEEQAGLIYMIEEEKLARDVYRTLYEKWSLPIFNNISKSEETHIMTVQIIATKYNIDVTDFYTDTTGTFTNETLQGLYTDLVDQGSNSLEEALRIGALIEEIDIVDLQGYLSQTENPDLILAYENLQKGSRNHLRSFVKNIETSYLPTYLSQEEYDSIVNTGIERGGRGPNR